MTAFYLAESVSSKDFDDKPKFNSFAIASNGQHDSRFDDDCVKSHKLADPVPTCWICRRGVLARRRGPACPALHFAVPRQGRLDTLDPGDRTSCPRPRTGIYQAEFRGVATAVWDTILRQRFHRCSWLTYDTGMPFLRLHGGCQRFGR